MSWAAAALVLLGSLTTFVPRAGAELTNPRQEFLRASTAGLFLHWGLRTSPAHTSCSTWENDVTKGGWSASYWVTEAQKLHAQYLVLASFHSRLGYARAWPSSIPGSCSTKRDFLGELITAAGAAHLKVILYMTDDPQWHNEGLPSGSDWLDSKAYSAYKGHTVDLTTRDGFGEFSYDNFVEVMQKYPKLGGFWIDNDNQYWIDHGLYEKIRADRPDFTLSNNNEDTPIMDMISNEQKTGMTPSYDYPQAVYTAAPRLIEADFKLPSTGAWWYDGSNPTVDRKLTLGRLVTDAGSSIKALMAETAQVNGRFPSNQEAFNTFASTYLDGIWPALGGTEGGGYLDGGLKPGAWNDGAYGVTTISRTDPNLQFVHVLTPPSTSTIKIRDNGYVVSGVTNLRTGAAVAHSQGGGTLTLTGLGSWDSYDTVFKVTTSGRTGIYPPSTYKMSASASAGGHGAAAAADGDYLTYWDSNKTTPVSLRFDLGTARKVQYIGINQREDSVSYARSDTEQSARIKSYRVYFSADGSDWGSPVKTGTLPSARGVAFIDLPATTTRHVRLEVVSTYAASSDSTRYKRLRVDEAWIGSAYPVRLTSAAGTFDVRDYGAKGNGSANDTGAIQKAIDAASAAGGGTVRVPSGTYKSANSLHLKSRITIQLDAGATIKGAAGTGYDKAESNPNDDYQDYGHSHFHDAMMWGDRLTGIGFTGSGTIDGGDHLITGNPGSGQADKILSLTRCDGLTLDGVQFRRGGHFAILTNNCNNIKSDGLRIDTASDRDGWNVISASNVTVTNATIAANDDALVFKSDYALGAKLPNGHVTVTGAHLSAVCCNALMFGSETCGDFTDYTFQGITITGANKSGLGMVSMDGANISDVHYKDITMSGVRSPIMQKIGTRKRCGNKPGVGHISDVTYENVTATGASPSFSPTLWGESGSNHISGVTFTNVNLTVPGGNGTTSTGVPSNTPTDYNPNSIGTRPAYGWYIHNADNIEFAGGSVRFAKDDGRPAVIANTGQNITFDHFTVTRGGDSPFDLGFQSITGYCVTASGSPRLSTTGSTSAC